MSKKIEFEFFYENKLRGRYVLTARQLKNRFNTFLRQQESIFLLKCNSETVIVYFIASSVGLNSAFNNTELQQVVSLLQPDLKNFINRVFL